MSRGVRKHHAARAAGVRVVVKGLLAACPSTSTTSTAAAASTTSTASTGATNTCGTHVHAPLAATPRRYMVSMGELGTTPETLELLCGCSRCRRSV